MRHRRDSRHGDWHWSRVGKPRHGRFLDGSGILLRLFADDATAAAVGLALTAVLPLAFAADTVSIAIVEVVGDLVMLVIPGAMRAGGLTLLFWGSLIFSLAMAFVAAFSVNR